MKTTYLVLTQYRDDSKYNDFIGKYYHFPANKGKSYLSQFEQLPIDFVYYEPTRQGGKGEFFGFGKITKKPFEDKREAGHYFVEIDDYKEFTKPVPFKNDSGINIEEQNNPHYNAQNAVRKISKELLTEICLDGGIILNLESDAHLIKVLGEQLIGSERVGVLELIKNSIDAQASYCRVRIEKVDKLPSIDAEDYEYPDLPGPVIIIEDDGIGMSKEIIENGWLRPASPLKTNIKEELKQEREKAFKSGNLGSYDALLKQLKKEHGRIPLGEKGVGRFATHRLGRYLELRTKTKDIPYELVLKIDWQEFDKVSTNFINLNSIGVSLFKEAVSKDFQNKQSGTKLIIYGGKDGFKWDKAEIKELARSIMNLNSPNLKNKFRTKVDSNFCLFKAYLECPQHDDLPTSPPHKEATPNFTFDILINDEGIAEISELKFKHPTDKIPSEEWIDENVDLRFHNENDREYWYFDSKKRKPQCGMFYIHLDIWYRTKEWIDLPDYKTLISYLDDYGGISIYRDSIMVLDSKLSSEYDWLGLGKKHIKQGFRISYRDFVGSVEINQKENYNLIDKTNREGLIDNQASKDLSKLVTAAIEKIVLPRYIRKREEFAKLTKGLVTDAKTLNDLAKTSSLFFTNVSESDYPLETDPYKFFSNLWEKVEERRSGIINLGASMKQLQKSIQMLEEVQDTFVEQAGFGIAVSMSLHEINKITSNFYTGISKLLKSGEYDKVKLEDLQEISLSLRSELKRLSPLRAIRNEDSAEFNILKSIHFTHNLYRYKFTDEKIHFEIINPEDDFNIYGKYSTINQVFGNLFDNSAYWTRHAAKKENIIKILLNKKYKTVIVADSGDDISDIIRPSLFQPGYSLKEPPSGLGLFICKTYLNNIKSRIYETPLKDRIAGMSGAHFTLDFHKNQLPQNQNIQIT
jgi:signal transduction histidine kinase